MKFSKQQIEDTMIDNNVVDDKIKQEIIINEYEKSQKNISAMWLGEGWYKTTPNSFNYFTAGFEAGMNYLGKKMNQEDINDLKTVLNEQLDYIQRLGKIPLPLGSIPDDKYEEIMILYNSIIECNKIMKEIVDGPVGGIKKLVERTK